MNCMITKEETEYLREYMICYAHLTDIRAMQYGFDVVGPNGMIASAYLPSMVDTLTINPRDIILNFDFEYDVFEDEIRHAHTGTSSNFSVETVAEDGSKDTQRSALGNLNGIQKNAILYSFEDIRQMLLLGDHSAVPFASTPNAAIREHEMSNDSVSSRMQSMKMAYSYVPDDSQRRIRPHGCA